MIVYFFEKIDYKIFTWIVISHKVVRFKLSKFCSQRHWYENVKCRNFHLTTKIRSLNQIALARLLSNWNNKPYFKLKLRLILVNKPKIIALTYHHPYLYLHRCASALLYTPTKHLRHTTMRLLHTNQCNTLLHLISTHTFWNFLCRTGISWIHPRSRNVPNLFIFLL